MDRRPTRKVATGTVGGAVATIAAWLVGLQGVDVPAGVEAAIATLVTVAVAYLAPDRPRSAPEQDG